jgi:hypothetical protein
VQALSCATKHQWVLKMNETNQTQLVTNPQSAWDALYDAHVLFVKELYAVRCSLDIMRIIGLNTNKLKGPGAEFVRFSSLLSQRTIVTGIENLFERNDEGTVRLCSMRGILSLAENTPLKNGEAAERFVHKYGVDATANWRADVEKVLVGQRPVVAACMKLTSPVRNQRVAHLSQPSIDGKPHMLPGIDACERIIEFAYDFYVFIATGFLNSAGGADLHDRVGKSLYALLKKRLEIEDALYDFPDAVSRF